MHRIVPLIYLFLAAAAPAAEPIAPATERAIERGLAWLVAGQHEDGGFGAGQLRGNVAVCALAGMAMMSEGSAPGRGPYGDRLNRSVDYLLAHTSPSGFIAGPDAGRGPMYGHGFATMFLAECYGPSPRAELRDKLADAVRIIIDCQNHEGGWRYEPVRVPQADISVTVCQIMALRAARNAGLFVPGETIDRAIDFVRKCQNADGGFRYMLEAGESAAPRSAAAVAALFSAGVYEGPAIDNGLGYLEPYVSDAGASRLESYFYYRQYYAAQAFWQAGGDRWDRWYPAACDELAALQRDDGAWVDPIGDVPATAMALIVLQMPNDCLPIFQR